MKLNFNYHLADAQYCAILGNSSRFGAHMTEVTTVKDAADRLQRALKNLEASLAPMVARVGDLEQRNADAKSSDADRSRLANELDELKAEHESLQSREAEFSKLAGETTQELDAVISEVMRVLGEGGGE